jgi:hypothetical protein
MKDTLYNNQVRMTKVLYKLTNLLYNKKIYQVEQLSNISNSLLVVDTMRDHIIAYHYLVVALS